MIIQQNALDITRYSQFENSDQRILTIIKKYFIMELLIKTKEQQHIVSIFGGRLIENKPLAGDPFVFKSYLLGKC